MSVQFTVDFSRVLKEIDRLAAGPGHDGTTFRLEGVMLANFQQTQQDVHVITGHLKAEGHPSSSFCVAPETRVLTSDLRWVPAGGVLPGDFLLAFDEDSRPGRKDDNKNRGRLYRSTVVCSAQIIRRPCYDLGFEDGTEVRCSAEHRWLAGGEQAARWVRTQNLVLSAGRVSRVIKPLDTWALETSRAAGYLAAAFDGEGCLYQGGPRQLLREGGEVEAYPVSLVFSQRDNEMLAETRWCLKQFEFDYGEEIKIGTGVTATRIQRRAEVLRFLGSIRPRRLLSRFDPSRLGRMSQQSVCLTRKTFAGGQPVVALTTASGTFFAEGLASHNSGDVWEGTISYPRHPGIFELARKDRPTINHPEGGHAFFRSSYEETPQQYRDAVLGFLRGENA